MKNNIKFRGKYTKTKEWVYGYAVKRGSEWFIDYETTDWISQSPLGKIEYRKIKVDERTIGQYVGFSVPNCSEIFADDIVEFKVFDGLAEFKGIGKVHFENGEFRLNSIHSLWDYVRNGEIEVLGNIHDNPELLNKCEVEIK